ncbi:MAG: M48 family peptidase [Deltaproteobacteria bacterium]|nr:MAG: M48 family peptidase [Deltaproteobacteria bacterium]
MADTRRRRLHPLRDLRADEFQHPADAAATEALKKVPGLDKAVAKIMEYGLERLFYLDNVASNVRVTERMFGRMHRQLSWACKILGVDEPELYVTVDPYPNAWTYGHTRPFVVLTSALVDMLDEEELLFVIAHELGHIKAGHVLYTIVARNIAAIMALVGQATLGIGSLLGQGLVYALLEWYRKAELTADRAGLLAVQDIDPCIRTFMKLAGGATRLYDQMDRDAFLEQIDAYEDADRSDLNRAYKVLLTLGRTHPFAIERAKELLAWHAGGYRDLFDRRGIDLDA